LLRLQPARCDPPTANRRQVGGIRRIIVPVELGYPGGDFRKQGPRPSTFAGERALDFVESNQGMIDKTLLFDVRGGRFGF
jgi:hypothetical protein